MKFIINFLHFTAFHISLSATFIIQFTISQYIANSFKDINNNMSKFYRLIKRGLQLTTISVTFGSIGGYAYLQYINSILGPIDIDKENAMAFYKQSHKMSDSQANRTYYWVLFHISLSRITSFMTYQSCCNKLNSKIVNPIIANYAKEDIITQIDKAQTLNTSRASRSIFNKIVDIRKVNADNIETREYIIKQIRTLQKEMYSNVLLNLPEQNRAKIEKIHKYICEMGRTFRDPQIIRYIQKLPQIQEKYPRDFLHKILFI